MNASADLRLVQVKDIPQILEIYRPFVLQTATSFETEVPSPEAFETRVQHYASLAPWLVAVRGEEVLGYAYSTAHRSRGAYRWTQETTVYVRPDQQRQGIARLLYEKLLVLLQLMGYTKALAVITLPNAPSILFHQHLGFQHIGEMKNIGYKLGQWHTTSWWDKDLQPQGYIPGEIKSMESIRSIMS
jgi:phosphinothricin acetyltransferase